MYRQQEYAVVDVETTGFSPKHHDRIVEIGIVRANAQGEVLDEYATLINPGRDVGATHVHGITAGDVADAPRFEEVVGDVLSLMRGAVLVAHNASFDLRFLSHECDVSRAPLPAVEYLCTLSLAKRLTPDLPSRRLAVLCEHFGIPLDGAHSALVDARATATLLNCLFGLLDPSVRTPLVDLGAKRVKSAVRAWPDVSATGRSYRRAAAVKRRQNAGRRLGRLLQSLPTRNDTDNAADEYLAVLERALEDREISEEELDALQEVARDLDMDRDEVRRAHRELLSDLIRVAWLDETITEAEQRDIEQVAGLLDIGGDEYIRMIEETQAEPTTPVASPADHPREDLAGLRVCFTGASEAILDGKPVTRSELKDLATERGMAVQPRVTKKLDLLVCADPKSQSSKARKARQYGVRIMAESAFLRYVGV